MGYLKLKTDAAQAWSTTLYYSFKLCKRFLLSCCKKLCFVILAESQTGRVMWTGIPPTPLKRTASASAGFKHPNRPETSLKKDAGKWHALVTCSQHLTGGRRPGIQSWLWHREDIHLLLCFHYTLCQEKSWTGPSFQNLKFYLDIGIQA